MAEYISDCHLLSEFILKGLDSDVPSLSSRIASAHAALRDFTQAMKRFTPISSLIPDILRIIFMLANNTQARLPSLMPPLPLVVSQVSPKWCTVALSIPQLWTAVHISFPWEIDLIRLLFYREVTALFN